MLTCIHDWPEGIIDASSFHGCSKKGASSSAFLRATSSCYIPNINMLYLVIVCTNVSSRLKAARQWWYTFISHTPNILRPMLQILLSHISASLGPVHYIVPSTLTREKRLDWPSSCTLSPFYVFMYFIAIFIRVPKRAHCIWPPRKSQCT